MADKLKSVEGSYPSTEQVQRVIYGDGYDDLKKTEREAAEKAAREAAEKAAAYKGPVGPWPTTEDVMRTLGREEPTPALKAAPVRPKIEKPKVVEPVQKVAEAEPVRATYKTRESKPE